MAKRPYLDAATMRPIYERYQKSKQSVKDFCAAEKINHHTFHYWRHKFLKEGAEPPKGFQEIQRAPARVSIGQRILIRFPGSIEVELPGDYNAQSLGQLLQKLTC